MVEAAATATDAATAVRVAALAAALAAAMVAARTYGKLKIPGFLMQGEHRRANIFLKS